MAKKFFLSSILIVFLFALFPSCKTDLPLPPVGSEPDSLFVGTPYVITAPQFGFPPISIPPDNPMTVEGIQLGRLLFYDPTLSSDSMFSCSSCHKQEFAFADGGKVLSQNIFGLTKRNTPPLFNLVWMKKYFWDGRAGSLPQQANDALIHEQNFIASQSIARLSAKPEYVSLFKKAFGRPGDITQQKIEKSIAQFMMTLISSESKFDSVQRGQMSFSPAELHGFNLFLTDTPNHGADCFHCHADNSAGTSFTMIDNGFHNNGLDAANSFTDFPDLGLGGFNGNMLDNGKFKTPHLRNVEVTGPYMRNGRFVTLEQVVNFYNDSLKTSPTIDPFMKTAYRGGLRYLSEQDKQDLIAFLKTLTDHRFLTNPDFSTPFH
ncbi:MAG: c-type cytochrome [Bacteroidetes bacterium]|nr:c-type cytochrome [Bacteroidota bacterium]